MYILQYSECTSYFKEFIITINVNKTINLIRLSAHYLLVNSEFKT